MTDVREGSLFAPHPRAASKMPILNRDKDALSSLRQFLIINKNDKKDKK